MEPLQKKDRQEFLEFCLPDLMPIHFEECVNSTSVFQALAGPTLLPVSEALLPLPAGRIIHRHDIVPTRGDQLSFGRSLWANLFPYPWNILSKLEAPRQSFESWFQLYDEFAQLEDLLVQSEINLIFFIRHDRSFPILAHYIRQECHTTSRPSSGQHPDFLAEWKAGQLESRDLFEFFKCQTGFFSVEISETQTLIDAIRECLRSKRFLQYLL